MKLPQLITRRRLKWTGTTLAVVVALTFGVSTKFDCSLALSPHETSSRWIAVHLAEGRVGLTIWNMQHVTPGTNLKDARFELTEFSINPSFLMLEFAWNGMSSYSIGVPLWFPLVLIAAPTAWLWLTDRRAKPWQCASCRYDLRGIEGGGNGKWGRVCPECGNATGGCA